MLTEAMIILLQLGRAGQRALMIRESLSQTSSLSERPKQQLQKRKKTVATATSKKAFKK